jgi:DNA-binding MarR family transcriptional regulator
MKKDVIDAALERWDIVRPDLDPSPMAVVGRVLRLAGHLERRGNEALKPFDLAIWGFDVLAALRRHGAPYAMTPTELMHSVFLSSGAMTNRIDRLEKLGFVERTPAQDDRRSRLVGLTPKGLRVVDEAADVRFQEAKESLGQLSMKETQLLAALLRKLMLGVESEGDV